MKFVDITNDIAFRKIFGNDNKKKTLISFLNAVINLPNNEKIVDVEIINPYQFADKFSLSVVGHAGWDKNPEHDIPYALCVSFEVIGSEINIYDLLAEAQIEIEPEQEVEV